MRVEPNEPQTGMYQVSDSEREPRVSSPGGRREATQGDSFLATRYRGDDFHFVAVFEHMACVLALGDKLGVDCHGKWRLGLHLRQRVSHGGVEGQLCGLLVENDLHGFTNEKYAVLT